MEKLFNTSGLLLAMLFAACADIPIENPEQNSLKVTRAAADSEAKDYYWSGGRKIYLEPDYTKMIVSVNGEEQFNAFATANVKSNPFIIGKNVALVDVRDKSVRRKIADDKSMRNKIFASTYSGYDDIPFYMTGEIVMQPKEGIPVEDILARNEVDAETVTRTDVGVVVRLKDWSKLLSTANTIYESEMVDWCHPDFITPMERTTNDQYFSQQYYLKNTGQTGGTSGVDINVEPAWAISTGTNIRVAVIDDGVEEHDDLAGRVLNGYTPLNPTYGNGRPTTQSGLPSGLIGHGQACAGIIAASHNTSYVAGVAPNVKIIPINIFHTWQYDSYYRIWHQIESVQNVAAAIEYAWNPDKGNADVISNSWGYRGIPVNADAITQQINNATNLGRLRNGVRKGCVVVFSSGNNIPYRDVFYPARLSNVIAVGAVDKSGTVWNYSCRGGELDVVAPSGDVNMQGDVYTLDRMGSNGYEPGNYTTRFGGTSAACPQVSGVAALILSKYPDFTQQQVVDIIQSTANRYPNRHYEYGYGLVDAHKALFGHLVISRDSHISGNATYTNTIYTYRVPEPPTGVSFSNWSISPSSYTVTGGTNNRSLTIKFTKAVDYTLSTHFILPNGSVFSTSKNVSVVPPKPVISADAGELHEPYLSAVSPYGNQYRVFWVSHNDSGRAVNFMVANWVHGDNETTYEWRNDYLSPNTGTDPYFYVPIPYQYFGPTLYPIMCRAKRDGRYSEWDKVFLYVCESLTQPYRTPADSIAVKKASLPAGLRGSTLVSTSQ